MSARAVVARLLGLVLVVWLAACAAPATSVDETDNPNAAESRASGVDDGAALFRIACAGCHRIEAEGRHDVGPNLYDIVGHPAASRPDYNYSAALASSGLVWDRATLSAWVVATEAMVPGTTMTYANILNSDEVERVVDFLSDRNEPVPAADVARPSPASN